MIKSIKYIIFTAFGLLLTQNLHATKDLSGNASDDSYLLEAFKADIFAIDKVLNPLVDELSNIKETMQKLETEYNKILNEDTSKSQKLKGFFRGNKEKDKIVRDYNILRDKYLTIYNGDGKNFIGKNSAAQLVKRDVSIQALEEGAKFKRECTPFLCIGAQLFDFVNEWKWLHGEDEYANSFRLSIDAYAKNSIENLMKARFILCQKYRETSFKHGGYVRPQNIDHKLFFYDIPPELK